MSQSSGGSSRCTVDFPDGEISVEAPAGSDVVCRSGYSTDQAGRTTSTVEVGVRHPNGDASAISIEFDAAGNKTVRSAQTRDGVTTTTEATLDPTGKILDSNFSRTSTEIIGNSELRVPREASPAPSPGDAQFDVSLRSGGAQQASRTPEKQAAPTAAEKAQSPRAPEKGGTTTIDRTQTPEGASTTVDHRGTGRQETVGSATPEKDRGRQDNVVVVIGERRNPPPKGPADRGPGERGRDPIGGGQGPLAELPVEPGLESDFITDLLFDTVLTLGIGLAVNIGKAIATGARAGIETLVAGTATRSASSTAGEAGASRAPQLTQNEVLDWLNEWMGGGVVKKGSNIPKGSDVVVMSKDGTKRVRIDLSRPHGDRPHVHLEVKENGAWRDYIEGRHRIYFGGD
jgi:hypothetical protein